MIFFFCLSLSIYTWKRRHLWIFFLEAIHSCVLLSARNFPYLITAFLAVLHIKFFASEREFWTQFSILVSASMEPPSPSSPILHSSGPDYRLGISYTEYLWEPTVSNSSTIYILSQHQSYFCYPQISIAMILYEKHMTGLQGKTKKETLEACQFKEFSSLKTTFSVYWSVQTFLNPYTLLIYNTAEFCFLL